MGRRKPGQRLAHRSRMVAATHDPGALGPRQLLDPVGGFREQGLVGGEGKELLGPLCARKRPEARPAPAREQYGVRAHVASTGSSAHSSNWRRMRAVAPQMMVLPIVYQVSS